MSGCPAAVLIGIDVSVEPGLAGASFFGRASAALLADVDRALEAATTKLRCCRYGSWSGRLQYDVDVWLCLLEYWPVLSLQCCLISGHSVYQTGK